LQNSDISPSDLWHDLKAAVGLLTRLPIKVDADRAMARGAASAWAYPLVGAVIAVFVGAVASAAIWLGIHEPVVAGLCLFTSIMITGAMHEDGLADSADGLWGGWTVERRLEIMKDSRIGTYGVLAVGLSLLLRFSAIWGLIDAGWLWAGLLIAGMGSRAVMLGLMGFIPNARKGGLSHSVGRPTTSTVLVGLGICILCLAIVGGWHVITFVLSAAICGMACASTAQRKIEGQTGDILGATQQVTEVVLLTAALAVLA